MVLTGRKKAVFDEIKKWELDYFITDESSRYYSLEMNLNEMIETWNPRMQKKLMQVVDSIIFHTHTIVQNSSYDKKTFNKILSYGRVFNENIEKISDMKKLTIDQLRFITNHHLAKQRLVSLTQGGVTGIGGLFFVTLDQPLMLTINMRTIQLIAMTYGYDVNKPYELMLTLKIFHVATLPKTLQKDGWDQLMQELDSYQDKWLLFKEDINSKSSVWLIQPIKQLAKGMTLFFLRKKLINGIPLIGMTIGASANYCLTKQVGEIAHQFYQKRLLLEHMK